MKNTQTLIDYFNRFPDGQDIIFRFFITFARLECALKNSSEYLTGDRTQAKPNWNKFVDELIDFNPDASTSLRESVDYIINNPPQKQIVQLGKLAYKESIENDPCIRRKLNVYIRRIRNNLLHGGKFDGNYIPEISRNYNLLNSALVIMNNWIDLNADIKHLYSSDIL
jgi:hypothetical protein